MENVFTRDNAANFIDMRWGNPYYMKQLWTHAGSVNINLSENIRYPVPDDPFTKNLEIYLRKTHKKFKNANTKNKHFVLGNGTMQILLAALYCIQKIKNKPLDVYSRPPYWARFKLLTEIASPRLNWSETNPGYDSCIEIKAVPNNPDNSVTSPQQNTAETQITDLCYNWPQYTKVKNYDEDFMVFGLSKMTGHAGSRIGWAWVADEELAVMMRQYIEVTVGGVSLDSQMKALEILHRVDAHPVIFDEAKKILTRRWNLFRAVSFCLDDYKMVNQDGMFIWCKAKNGDGVETFKRLANSLGVSGEGFGVDKSYVRLNLGCEEKHFFMFIDNLWSNLTNKP